MNILQHNTDTPASILNNKSIYSLGDSHCLFWIGWNGVNLKYYPPINNYIFTAYPLGPILAYSLNKFNTNSLGREKFESLISKNIFSPPLKNYNPIINKPIIMTSFGEIDIRAHILKDGCNNYKEKLTKSINSYMEFIDFYSEQFIFIIYGPIASQKDTWFLNKRFPRFGTEYERNMITKEYNLLLSDEAKKRNIMFFTLFDQLIDEHYNTKEEYIIDECHISTVYYDKFVGYFKEKFINFFNLN